MMYLYYTLSLRHYQAKPKPFQIVAHVHDEVIIEAPTDVEVDAVCGIMGQTPDWLPGIELNADGYGCMAYRKS